MYVAQDMPSQMDHLELCPEAAALEALPDGAKGAVPLDTVEELKENLKAFTDSVHAKAASVVAWQTHFDGMTTTDRVDKLLFINFSQGSVVLFDVLTASSSILVASL